LCLNSKPLYAINDSSSLALTPSHFLLTKDTVWKFNTVQFKDPLTRQFIAREEILNELWTVMKNEYMKQLVFRNKWRNIDNTFQINDVFLIQEDNCSPSNWPLARIIELHKDSQGNSRVATVVSRGNEDRVATFKLIKLPTEAQINSASKSYENFINNSNLKLDHLTTNPLTNISESTENICDDDGEVEKCEIPSKSLKGLSRL
jgi:hypothetical protein